MDRTAALDIVARFANLAKRHFPIKQVVLFGSFAEQRQSEFSDIDVAVIVDKWKGDLLEGDIRLHELTWDVDVRIEPILLEDGYDPSGFLDHIKATGIVVYSSEQDAIPAK
jgi:predicted nucleotidyltransferase